MANCSIPNSTPAIGRTSTPLSRQSRRQNSAFATFFTAFGLRKSIRSQTVSFFNVQCSTSNAQRAIRAVGCWTLGVRRWAFSASWRVKGAWWSSRSSKPLSVPHTRDRGRFDSYPLRLNQMPIGDCGLRIAECPMTTQELKNRTFEFGVRVITAVEALPKTETAKILGRQLLRAGTSVGANYRAAARARSQADFISKLGLVEEECDESAYWMEMIARKLLKRAKLDNLYAEANELLAITVASIKTARRRRVA